MALEYHPGGPRGGKGARRSKTDNGDGTVTDNVTGLMWAKDPSPRLPWIEALGYCAALDLGGYEDWRMSNIVELLTLYGWEIGTGVLASGQVSSSPSRLRVRPSTGPRRPAGSASGLMSGD